VVTRVPSDDPERLEPARIAERLAEAFRHHLLAAAQASLKAFREVLARFPADARAPDARPAATAPAPAADVAPVDPPVPRPAPPRAAVVPPPPPAELLRDDALLPDSYGSDRLVLLARDPHCLYAYWDLSPAHVERVLATAGSDALRVVLRTYDATQIAFDATPPARFQDFAVAGNARSLYAYVGKPASSFVAEVGFLRNDGAFFPLARSAPVWTPRTEQPGTAPGQWMTVGWREPRNGTAEAHAGEVVTVASDGTTTAELEGAERLVGTRQAPSSWPGPTPPGAQRGSWSLVRGKRTAQSDVVSET
jgi:hypothetical protein